MPLALDVDHERLAALCRRFHVTKLELFGSRATGTARPDSDVDLLVTFEPAYTPGLEFFGMSDEFAALFGHPVDLLTRRTVEQDRNPYFRTNVLSSAQTVYAA
jgi:predicted nucleotidyltransferase